MKALVVAAARPNFVKVGPVLTALEGRGVECVLVHTGQHYDRLLSQVFFDELGIRPPDVNLGVGSGSHASQTGQVMMALEPVVDRHGPDVVVVVGDVNSTLAAALVGAKAGVMVAHVEAGLRSRDWSMPEEVNRVATDSVSDVLLAPSQEGVDNLIAEGRDRRGVHLVGNVMIDALVANLERARSRPIPEQIGVPRGGFGLVTLHRPSNVDDPSQLQWLVEQLTAISKELPLVFPVHPRTRERLPEADSSPGLHLIEPLGYLDFLGLQDAAAVVLTDSGGVQQETTVLGTPCLTLRDNTEWPITVSHGTNTVVGSRPIGLVETVLDAVGRPVHRRGPDLWDGRAGERCATAIIEAEGHGSDRRSSFERPAS